MMSDELLPYVSLHTVLSLKNSSGMNPINLKRLDQSSTALMYLLHMRRMNLKQRYLPDRTWSRNVISIMFESKESSADPTNLTGVGK